MAEFALSGHGQSYTIEIDPEGLIGRRIASAGQPYEFPLLEHIWERGFKGVAVDGGAHVGNHTLWLAVVCGLEVWAFEPLCYEELVHNVELNDLQSQVHPVPVALGAEHGQATIVGRGKLEVGGGEVPVVPLDDYQLEDVSVIKLDIEDMEPFALMGARRTVERCQPVIFAEARDDNCHQAIANVLEPGYRMTARFGVRWTPVECWEPR